MKRIGKLLSSYSKIASTPSVQMQSYTPVTPKIADTITEANMSSMPQINLLKVHISNKIDKNYTVDTSYSTEGAGRVYIPQYGDIQDYWYGSPL